MSDLREPDRPEVSMAAELDVAATGLLALWDAARERTTSQLSGSQLRALIVVEGHDGINLRGLANSVGMLLSSASRLCDRLVAAGLLEREPGRVDRREISLHLTPAGQTLMTQLREDRRERLAAVLAGMSPDGQQALLRGLGEFDAVSQAVGPSPGAGRHTDRAGETDDRDGRRPDQVAVPPARAESPNRHPTLPVGVAEFPDRAVRSA